MPLQTFLTCRFFLDSPFPSLSHSTSFFFPSNLHSSTFSFTPCPRYIFPNSSSLGDHAYLLSHSLSLVCVAYSYPQKKRENPNGIHTTQKTQERGGGFTKEPFIALYRNVITYYYCQCYVRRLFRQQDYCFIVTIAYRDPVAIGSVVTVAAKCLSRWEPA